MSCAHLDEARQKEIPKVSESQEESEGKMFYSMATKNGVQYRLGDGVFLLPDAFHFRLVCKLISAGTRGDFVLGWLGHQFKKRISDAQRGKHILK